MKSKLGEDSTFSERTVISPIASINPHTGQRMPALLAIAGHQIGRSFPIDKEEFMIGRVENCDLWVEDDLVSRHHCKIIFSKEGAQLVDLASTNGTLVNGHRVERIGLSEGDQIQVGASTILKYHLQADVERKFLTELYDAATKDYLTGTYNKRYFLDRMLSEFSYVQRDGGRFSIILLDVDHFKKVNDTYGHIAGDVVLKKVAHYIAHNTRKHDMVARYGGEEFIIFIRESDFEQAKALAENLREGVSQLVVDTAGHKIKVTISLGLSQISESNRQTFDTLEKLIAYADANLYRAKGEGRNRVCY